MVGDVGSRGNGVVQEQPVAIATGYRCFKLVLLTFVFEELA